MVTSELIANVVVPDRNRVSHNPVQNDAYDQLQKHGTATLQIVMEDGNTQVDLQAVTTLVLMPLGVIMVHTAMLDIEILVVITIMVYLQHGGLAELHKP